MKSSEKKTCTVNDGESKHFPLPDIRSEVGLSGKNYCAGFMPQSQVHRRLFLLQLSRELSWPYQHENILLYKLRPRNSILHQLTSNEKSSLMHRRIIIFTLINFSVHFFFFWLETKLIQYSDSTNSNFTFSRFQCDSECCASVSVFFSLRFMFFFSFASSFLSVFVLWISVKPEKKIQEKESPGLRHESVVREGKDST